MRGQGACSGSAAAAAALLARQTLWIAAQAVPKAVAAGQLTCLLKAWTPVISVGHSRDRSWVSCRVGCCKDGMLPQRDHGVTVMHVWSCSLAYLDGRCSALCGAEPTAGVLFAGGSGMAVLNAAACASSNASASTLALDQRTRGS